MKARWLLPGRFVPYFILMSLTTLLISISWNQPLTIEYDMAFQLKSLQQFIRRESTMLNFVTVVNPSDLSQDIQSWISWYSPGVPIIFFPLYALGLPLGISARLTSYILLFIGFIGWIKVAEIVKVKLQIIIVIALLLPLYFGTISMGATTFDLLHKIYMLPSLVPSLDTLYTGDMLPFAAIPWLIFSTIQFSLNADADNKTYTNIFIQSGILGFCSGLLYWLKYSAFPVAVGIFLYLNIFYIFIFRKYSLKKRLCLLCSYFVCFILPVLCLMYINYQFTGYASATSQYKSSVSEMSKNLKPGELLGFFSATQNVHGLGLLVSLLGSIGLALFQSCYLLVDLFRASIINFSLLHLRYDTLLTSIMGIPGTVVAIFFIYSFKKNINNQIYILALCITFVPFVLLAYLSNSVGFNYLSYVTINRYTSPFMIFIQILIMHSYMELYKSIHSLKKKSILLSTALLFFVVPNLFIFSNLAQQLTFRETTQYISTSKFIAVPTLARVNLRAIVEQIESVANQPKDVVVLVGDTLNGAWLEMDRRTLLVANNSQDLTKFKSSQPLRVILAISKSSEEDRMTLPQLKQKFPQAAEWSRLPTAPDASVSIFYSDLTI